MAAGVHGLVVAVEQGLGHFQEVDVMLGGVGKDLILLVVLNEAN